MEDEQSYLNVRHKLNTYVTSNRTPKPDSTSGISKFVHLNDVVSGAGLNLLANGLDNKPETFSASVLGNNYFVNQMGLINAMSNLTVARADFLKILSTIYRTRSFILTRLKSKVELK